MYTIKSALWFGPLALAICTAVIGRNWNSVNQEAAAGLPGRPARVNEYASVNVK